MFLDASFFAGGMLSDKASSTVTRDVGFWILFAINLLLMMLSFTLNLFLTVVLIRITVRDLCVSSFYTIERKGYL
ncbi:hypothetical protein Y032_0447g1631 [Ancylostoma ceylanicum]|uniref:Uncharacterized protein n=1 Tax=Ancylostoma ceylanicum TaxID=53326 RepID=A0A016WYF8_9BILA|nr:hypothetical protein Y032_0447g1631 [Ancylostoma ceylanicum]